MLKIITFVLRKVNMTIIYIVLLHTVPVFNATPCIMFRLMQVSRKIGICFGNGMLRLICQNMSTSYRYLNKEQYENVEN